MRNVSLQDVARLFVLALPIAAVAWTVTHEELFRELHDYCVRRSQECQAITARKFFYLLTCEYCFSHYVAAAVLLATRFTLLYDGWRGYLIAWFALVWVANHYVSLYARLRLDLRKERLDITLKEAVSKTAAVRKAV